MDIFIGIAVIFFALGGVLVALKPRAPLGKIADFSAEAHRIEFSDNVGQLWFQEYAQGMLAINVRSNLNYSFRQWERLLYQIVQRSEIAESFDNEASKTAGLLVIAAALAKCMIEKSDGGAGYAAGVNTLLLVGVAQLLPPSDAERELERAFRHQHSDIGNLYHHLNSNERASLLDGYRKALKIVFDPSVVEDAVRELVDHFSYLKPSVV